MKRLMGLSNEEVNLRTRDGLVNKQKNRSSRSTWSILRANIFTRFNAILTTLAVAVILIDQGSPFNALFGLAMVINSAIGIFQELRAKFTLDRLSILNAPSVRVIRGGKKSDIAMEDVVYGDYVSVKLGDQIVADGEVLDSQGLEIDESLLTGESDPIFKHVGDTVLSGSVVVAGQGIMRADKIGSESYSAKLAIKAKKFQRANSELINGTNKLLKWISWLLVPVVPLLLIGQLRLDLGSWREAVIHSTAAIVGMIPEGLVLLTSTAFMLAVINLARRKVLIQQMPAVETLARVDTLLLDKTGTLTEGEIGFEAVILEFEPDSDKANQVLATIASRAASPTNNAIAEALAKVKPQKFKREIPFNSSRKWSAIEIGSDKWIFGAPEVIFSNDKKAAMFKKSQKIAAEGKRVLALVKAASWPKEPYEIPEFESVALVVLSERIRDDAAQILGFFRDQQVDIKIISGDSPLTVAAVAQKVNFEEVKVFDARELPDPKKSAASYAKFNRIIQKHNVFGRVQPEQKRQICAALQANGRIVAMTGDGVNDALALKKSDLGIAMNSGAAATKAVAEVVLLDNKFSHLPNVLSEGRRVIANIERVANLFIIKNVYSLLLALSVTVAGQVYPYLPAQMTVISTLSIGIPAFFLALAPNNSLYRPGFLNRVLKFAIPVGFIAALFMMLNYMLLAHSGMSMQVIGTSVSITMMMIGMSVLVALARPLKGWKLGLIAACAVTFVVIITVPFISKWFEYSFDANTLLTTLLTGGLGAAAVWLVKTKQETYGKI